MSLVSVKKSEIRALNVMELALVSGGNADVEDNDGWGGWSHSALDYVHDMYDGDSVQGFCEGLAPFVVGGVMTAVSSRVPIARLVNNRFVGGALAAGLGGLSAKKLCPHVAQAGQWAVNAVTGHHHHHHHH